MPLRLYLSWWGDGRFWNSQLSLCEAKSRAPLLPRGTPTLPVSLPGLASGMRWLSGWGPQRGPRRT